MGPYECDLGWRYVRAGRGGRRNRFISFISLASIVGIALGVAALIVVLSVMNGFERVVRERMLGVIAHLEVADAGGAGLADPQALAARALRVPGVVAAAPRVAGEALLGRGDALRGVLLAGIAPPAQARVTPLAARLLAQGTFAPLAAGTRRIVLGAELARQLDARAGDAVTLVLPPAADGAGAGALPRLVRFTVAGTFEAGHYEYDSMLAYLDLADAAEALGLAGPNQLQLALADPDSAPEVARAVGASLGPRFAVRDWTRTNRTWFEALHLQKRMMAVILVLIVAVAAFNLVSTLVMTVADKRADIAILRTLGATPRSVMGVFVVQGAAAGIIGTALGVAGGLAIALEIGVLVPALERVLDTHFLAPSVYVIGSVPSEPRTRDIVPIALVSLVLAFVATLYPSWRASRVDPAAALRQE